jgi:hypothetical protein
MAVVLIAVAITTWPARAAGDGAYAPPVDGPIVDHFRPPATPYGAGNRGVDFRTEPGAPVRAAADGTVVFAGQVGASRHVVVLHPDGLRTSYSFLVSVEVARGDHVRRGDVVGHAGHELHFGVRAGERYLDPEPLLAGAEPDVHLVPVVARRPGSIASELAGLVAGLGRGAQRASAAGVDWARRGAGFAVDGAVAMAGSTYDQVVAVADAVDYYLDLPMSALAKYARAERFREGQRQCTPPERAPPPPPARERIAVLVGGLGSTSTHASIRDVDTRALGYPDDHVAVFSYAGGQTGGVRAVAGVPARAYGADQANGDLRASAARFRDLLEAIRLTHPGVAVDVIAHSQGGLVVRAALGADGDEADVRLPDVAHLVTLGSPHHGADLATANGMLALSPAGMGGQVLLDQAGVPATSDATAQLAERSGFIDGLQHRPLPVGARVTSIAAAGDVVVPALQSALDGATNVLVPLSGLDAHAALPGSAAARRELALALSDRGPTCRPLDGDLRRAFVIGVGEDLAGGVLAGAGAAVSQLAAHG